MSIATTSEILDVSGMPERATAKAPVEHAEIVSLAPESGDPAPGISGASRHTTTGQRIRATHEGWQYCYSRYLDCLVTFSANTAIEVRRRRVAAQPELQSTDHQRWHE